MLEPRRPQNGMMRQIEAMETKCHMPRLFPKKKTEQKLRASTKAPNRELGDNGALWGLQGTLGDIGALWAPILKPQGAPGGTTRAVGARALV